MKMLDGAFLNTIKEKISKNEVRFKLLYKATIDGDTAQTFHFRSE